MNTEYIAEQYIPQVGDKFTIRWKQHYDRSYIAVIWTAIHTEGDTVIGFSKYGDYLQDREIVFRTFDVEFSKVGFDKQQANLIESAPDLYEATKWLKATLLDVLAGKVVRDADEVILFAEKALVKANQE
jgi:hypothetical protein